MSAAGPARPWWASEPGDDRPAPDPDPLARHRAARRGGDAPEGGVPADDVSGEAPADWLTPAVEALGRLGEDLAATATANAAEAARRRPDDDPTAPPPWEEPAAEDGRAGPPHRVETCGVCPVCLAIRALGESRPELVAHLAEAARHVTLAFRSVLDGPTAPTAATDESARERRGGLTRIDLDEEAP